MNRDGSSALVRFGVGIGFIGAVLGLAGLAIWRFEYAAEPLAPVLAAFGAILATAGLPLLARLWFSRP